MLFNSVASLLALGTALAAAVPAPVSERSSGCASGLYFTGQAGCSQCTKEGNIVCGRDEDRTTDLKCTRFSTGLTWVPIDNPGTCGVDSPYPPASTSTYGKQTCDSGKPFTGQVACTTCSKEDNIVCGRDKDATVDLKCTRFSTGLIWVPVKNPHKCGSGSPYLMARDHYYNTCPSGKPFTGQAGCSTCSKEGNIVCGRDEGDIADLKCTRFSTGLVWVPVKNPHKCGVDSPYLMARDHYSNTCPSGKPFTGQAGCSTCSKEGNIVCGRDEDVTADLKCTRFSTGLVWVPVKNPHKCGVDSPYLMARDHYYNTCPSGKPFTGQAGCSTCSKEGNIVCGRDEGDIADLKCTRFSTGLVWVPVKNPHKCGVDSPYLMARDHYYNTCPSGKPFTGQAGCSTCSKEGNIVCGRDEDVTADLKCTRFSTGLVWVPVKNPHKCGVDSPYLMARDQSSSYCPSGKPFTGQAGCSTCAKEGNIVCGRDEGDTADLKCTRFSTGLVWVPVKNPGKCGVDSPSRNSPTCASGKPFTGQAGCSKCATVNNIVCGRDEDRVTDLKCTQLGPSLTWIPVDDPKKCGV